MYCKNCGEFIKETENFCTACERPVNRIIPIREKRKMGKKGTAFIIILLVTVFISIGVLLNISRIFGAVDLGIVSSEKAYNTALTKFKSSIQKLDGYTDIVLTNEELSSVIKYNWPENKVARDIQIKINENGIIEASGYINKNYISQYLIGENNGSIKKLLPMFDILPEYTEVYIKFKGEVKNNQVNLIDIQKVEVAGIQIPENLYENVNARNQLADGINKFLDKISEKTGASFDLVKAKSGKLIIQGLLPEIVKRKDLASAIEEFSYK